MSGGETGGAVGGDSIHLGPIGSIRTHMIATHRPIEVGPPTSLCQKGGDRMGTGLHLYAKTAEKVTCPNCLEWLHA